MKTVGFLLIALVLILAVSGCAGSASVQGAENNGFDDYFPMDAGRQWTYDISIGEIDPWVFSALYVEQGKMSHLTYSTRRILTEDKSGPFSLVLRVKGRYQADSMEVEVVKDDLGLYEDVEQIYWTVHRNQRTLDVFQFFRMSDKAFTNFNMQYPVEKISCSRYIFIWNADSYTTGIDQMSYAGIDRSVPAYEGIPCYHLLRTITQNGKNGMRITEDSWYAPQKGLVRLEQKINGRSSMVWILSVT